MQSRTLISIAVPFRRGDFQPEFIASLARTLIEAESLGFKFEYLAQEGCLLWEQRNRLARAATGDYLLFADSDMIWQHQDVTALLALNKDIAGGLCCLKFSPFSLTVLEEKEKGILRNMAQVPAEPFMCAAIGTGFLLIRRRVLETMLAPEFIDQHGYPFDPWWNQWWRFAEPFATSTWAPEDINFCLKARQAGFEVWCHPQVRLGHVGSFVFHPDLFAGINPLKEVQHGEIKPFAPTCSISRGERSHC